MEWKFKITTSIGHTLVSQNINDALEFIVPADTTSNKTVTVKFTISDGLYTY